MSDPLIRSASLSPQPGQDLPTGAPGEASEPRESAYHYQVIKRAIDLIDQSSSPLSLNDLAAAIGMSPAHFQRLFSQWAGVSPKRYQQYLTLAHAKSLLRDRFTTLQTSEEAGLTSQGRLHDLFVTWEAMSPGEYARKGAGLNIRYGWFDSPFGEVLAMGTGRGLCGLAFTGEVGREAAMDDMRARWPNAVFSHDPAPLAAWTHAAFGGPGHAKLFLIGAPLQIKVWEALLAIPSGHVSTYSELARAAGAPRAVRAVGTAVGRNPVSWLVPCHRALRKSGALGGYHWGLPVKRAMLAWEGARADARTEGQTDTSPEGAANDTPARASAG
jgi:AraC family transcriptional regulator, regulatory protein of adaptative response / methylated-DNA-[protein]-cysteine methyltransferase